MNDLQSVKLNDDLFNDLCRNAYDTAKKHGWHDTPYSVEHYLALVISELSEALEADRCGSTNMV